VETSSSAPIAKRPRSVAIIGGGIAGLAAAHRLAELAPDTKVTLFEASDRLGGVLQTDQRDGYLIERAADMFVTQPEWALDLCSRVELTDQLIDTDQRFRRAFVVRRGELVPVPAGFALMQPARIWPLVKSPLLSWRGKFRAALEYFVPRRRIASSSSTVAVEAWNAAAGGSRALQLADETLASFARRRLGREVFERLVQPLVGGIYTADPEKLSLAATLPRFLEMEHEYRSLIRAAWQERKCHARMKPESADAKAGGVRYGMFVAPRGGMASLVDATASRLDRVAIRLRTPIAQLQRTAEGRWRIISLNGLPDDTDYDAVVVAAPSHVASGLMEPLDAHIAAELRAIEYAHVAIVCLGYQRSRLLHPLDGFGFVVPAIERRQILAASFASVKFTGRAPPDRVLIRVFIGGALQKRLLEQDDPELKAIACRELMELIGAQGEPELVSVVRWNYAMPQYHLGHLERVQRIESAAAGFKGLHIAGSAYRGVGVPHCIQSGREAAERALDGAF
jgi:oxygen-dependent protoporphyrinogen oxidase